jgi:hypothetical protein
MRCNLFIYFLLYLFYNDVVLVLQLTDSTLHNLTSLEALLSKSRILEHGSDLLFITFNLGIILFIFFQAFN